MAENEFYKVGGTIHFGAPSYVVRQADHDLYTSLKTGEFSYVLDSRQLGKSSLMVHTAARLREDGLAVVILDLTAVGQTLDSEQWYAGLLNQVAKELCQAGLDVEDELDEFWLSRREIGPLQRWVEALREVVLVRWRGQLVVFVDEIDAVRSLQFSADEFFAGIRETYNRRARDPELNRITFCLLGVAMPSELIRDPRTTPFNIGRRVELEDFTEAEAAPLVQGMKRDEALARRLLGRILYWTAGHPYLTQSLCRAVSEDPKISGSSGVDRKCREKFLSRGAREKDDNLLFVSNRLVRSETDTTAVLDLYSKIRASDCNRFGRRLIRDQKDNRLINHLRLAGITRVTDGYLRVRNRIYSNVFDREWISSKMPNDEKRRLEAAYRRGALRASAIAAVVVLAGLGGTWIYLDGWVLERQTYYKEFVKHWGIPKGVGRLAPWQVRRRYVSYKFVTRGRFGALVRVQAVNSAGTLVPNNPVGTYLKAAQEDTRKERECQWEYILDNSGRVVYEKAKDRFGRLVRGLIYSPREEPVSGNKLARATPNRSEKVEAFYVGPNGYPMPQRGSSAEYVEITYDKDGLEEQILYRDRNRNPMPGPDRAYGRRCMYKRGVCVEMVSLDAKEALTVDTAGNCEWDEEYDDSLNLVEGKARDANGRLVLLKDGYSIVKQKFDSAGNLTEQSFFDTAGRPAPNKNGVADCMERYDERGNIIEAAYLDERLRPVRSKEGYARWTASYDERGNMIEVTFFDERGNRTQSKNGFARVRAGYDRRGNRTEEAYFDEDDKPSRIGVGYARLKMRYDEHGNVIETAYFDGGGDPLPREFGYARQVASYDERDDKTEEAYLDEDGKPVRIGYGYARWTGRYDERGNRIEEAYFDEQGNRLRREFGFARWTGLYDERGNRIEEAYFDEQDKPLRSKDGYARLTASYDERGNRIAEAYFDEAANPVRSTNGYARRTATYDARNNKTEEAYFDEDGKALRNKDGYARLKASYDERDNRTEEAYFDEDGKPLQIWVGYARLKTRYDARGNVIETDYFDGRGNPLRHEFGYACRTASYDTRDYETEEAYFDEEGKALRTGEGYARLKASCDERGNQTEVTYFDEGGKPVQIRLGYARWTARYDDRGNRIEEAYFDEQGKPLRSQDGYARLTASYDERRNKTGEAYFDEAANPVRSTNGYARWAASYDARGNRTEEAHFDEGGHPLRREFGFARWTASYDARNNKTEEAYFDEDGNGLRNKDGYARLKASYDERGNKTEEAYLDAGANPVRGKDGYARWTAGYDARGDRTGEAYFDEGGSPMCGKDGYARLRASYDEHGNKTEEAYFDQNGKPMRSRDGYARVTASYDERGNKIEEAYFDEEGKPTRSKNDYASSIQIYNERQYVIYAAFFDEQAKRLFKMVPTYDVGGHIASRELSGLDGKNGYLAQRQILDENGNIVEDDYLDSTGRPSSDNGGISIIRRKFDKKGKLVDASFFDTNRQPIHVFAQILEVASGGPGERAGLCVGDVVLSYDGKEVRDIDQFVSSIQSPGESPRRMRILRAGAEQTLEVPPGFLNVVVRNVAETKTISMAKPE